jgi:hypothetical protein
MKYTVRAIKYFFYFAIITTFIVLALVLIGAVEGDINEIFEGGYEALWKIAAFFAVIAAVYPKVGFIRREIPVSRGWTDIREETISYFRDRRYILESENGDTITFRCKDLASRLAKMNEDRITIRIIPEGYEMEGLRKDVLRLAAGWEHRLNPED